MIPKSGTRFLEKIMRQGVKRQGKADKGAVGLEIGTAGCHLCYEKNRFGGCGRPYRTTWPNPSVTTLLH